MKKRLITLLIAFICFFGVAFSNYLYFESQFMAGASIPNVKAHLDYNEDFNGKVDEYIDNGEITVALYNSGYLYNNDTDSGFNKDVIEEISRRMNIDIVLKVMPRARIYSMLEDGSLPISVSTVKTTCRAKYSWFIPYFSAKNYVLVRADADLLTEEELLSAPGIKVGIIRGYYYGQYYEKLIQKLKDKHRVVEAADSEDVFKMMKEDWIQVTFALPASYLYYFKNIDDGEIIVKDWAPKEESLQRCISLNKQYFTVNNFRRVQKTIQEMKIDGALYKIYSRYLPENVAKEMCEF